MTRFSKTSLALAAFLALSGCKVEVYDSLSQRDANEMTALLLASGLDAQRQVAKDGTFTVLVAEDDFAQAVNLISDNGLPRQQFASMVDVINSDRLIASPNEERARLAYAISQELSRTVTEIEGVMTARVHLAIQSDDPLARDKSRSTASVAIQHDGDFNTSGLVPRIKLLVANAVNGLDYDNVSIALFPVSGSGRSAEPASYLLASEPTEGASGQFASYMTSPDNGRAAAVEAERRVTPAAMPRYATFVAILAGGLMILLLAARSLLAPPARKPVTRKRRSARH